MKKRLLVVAMVLCLAALIAIPVSAAEPWLRVRFLQVLVNMDVDGDASIGDDLTVTDAVTIGGDMAVTGAVSGADLEASDDAIIGDDARVTGDLIANTGTFTTSLTTAAFTLSGSIVDSNSAVTVADNAIVDGAADAIQLTVQGYTTQTADLFVVETSAGTDLVTTDITNTTFAQPVIVDGAADAIQLTVQGYTTQTNFLFVAETSAGTDKATISNAGIMTLAGGLVISDGDATVADDLKIAKQTAITVTNGAAFIVTGSYQPIQAAGEVTPTITMGAAGDTVVLVNVSAQTINIADTGTTMLSAAWAAGQYDTLTLICDGTNWLELSRSDN